MFSGHLGSPKRNASGLLIAALLSCSSSKPKAFAPTDDFVHRHSCPAGRVEVLKEGGDRVYVSGCGKRETYVRDCANRPLQTPGEQPPRMQITEAEARHHPRSNSPYAPIETGCAWSREQKHPNADWKPGAD